MTDSKGLERNAPFPQPFSLNLSIAKGLDSNTASGGRVFAMAELSAYFTVPEAARELGASEVRVRELIEAKVLAAEKVGGRWLITPESVHSRKRTQRRRGRPLSARALWQLIDSGLIAQLLVEADEPARHNIRVQLVNRAVVRDVYVLPQLVRRIGPVVAPGGRSLAEAADVPAGTDRRWELDAYVSEEYVDELRRSKLISGVKGSPNVRLRVVDSDGHSWHQSRAGRLLVAWLDLADDGDRAADLTLNALVSELRCAHIKPFPVGNEIVAKVSLATLAALNDELS